MEDQPMTHAEENGDGIRFVDKRGQGKRASAPVIGGEDASEEEREELRRKLMEQAEAAEQATAAEPAITCAAFVLISIDHGGIMRLHHQADELKAVMQKGISAEREATSTDVSNIAGQLQLMIVGNEVSSRVLQAINIQAQQAMAAARGAGGIAVPQPVAQNRRP